MVGALSAAAAVLLIVAGIAKIRTPAPAAAMIVRVRPRVRRPLRWARCAGTVEVTVGLAALFDGGRVALALLAAGYLVLTVVALRLGLGAQKIACGCFGAADGVVGPAHVVVDLACLAAACWGIADPPGAVWHLFAGGTVVGITTAGQTLLLAALAYLSITALPALAAARREAEGPS